MDNNPILTVMIPVYNVEKFVYRAIKSVEIQQMADCMEILVVDDGSKDKSGEICDSIQKKYHNIRVVHQKNAGVSAARNLGITMAKGKYIAFLDADDWWNPDFFDKNMKDELSGSNNDIIGFSYRAISSDMAFSTTFHVQERTEYYEGFATGRFRYYPFWAFMYRTDFLRENDLELFPVKINEDTSFTERCFCVAKSVRWIDRNICNHWNNMTSVSTTMRWKDYFDEHFKSYLFMREWHEKYGFGYDVDSRAAIIFSIILKDLCAYNSYSFVKRTFDENEIFHIVYRYQELDINEGHRKVLGKWIEHPKAVWLKYHTLYRVKNDIIVFVYQHKWLNHLINKVLYSTLYKHDILSETERKFIEDLEI